jgi:hypothetical protein
MNRLCDLSPQIYHGRNCLIAAGTIAPNIEHACGGSFFYQKLLSNGDLSPAENQEISLDKSVS